MNAHSRVMRRALQLFLFVGMLLGLTLLRPAPVAHAINTNSDCFVLSNEAPGNLISKLDVAGYGNDNMYQALVALQQATGYTEAIPDSFLQVLAAEPVSAQIFHTQLKDVDLPGITVEICTNGMVQTVPVYGSSAVAQGFPLLTSHTSMSGFPMDINFTHSTGSVPVASWDVTSGVITTTYKVFGVAWGQPLMLYLPLVVR